MRKMKLPNKIYQINILQISPKTLIMMTKKMKNKVKVIIQKIMKMKIINQRIKSEKRN